LQDLEARVQLYLETERGGQGWHSSAGDPRAKAKADSDLESTFLRSRSRRRKCPKSWESLASRFWWGRPKSRGLGDRDKVGRRAQKEARRLLET
jgi:hypothetical protein